MFKSIKVLLAVLVIAIGAWAQVQPPVITTTLPNGKVGVSYSVAPATGSNITLSLESGKLPPGLEFQEHVFGLDFKYIRGTPTEAGTYTFTVKAENAAGSDTKEFTIVIEAESPPVMTTETLPNGIVSVSYSVNPATGSNITLSVESGELPPGLEIEYGSFRGTPTEAGTYTFTAKAENSGGSDTKEFTIVIEALQPPVITATTLPNGKVGLSYDYNEFFIEATGYNITWSIVSGPSWLEFLVPPSSRNFIIISGTPTEIGTFTFTVKAENAAGSDTKEFTIVIETWPPPVITTTTLPNGEVSVYYYANIEATATLFIERITWSVESGELPPGLQLFDDDIYHFNRGIINGTPTQTGTYTFTVKAENAYGSDTKDFTIVIGEDGIEPVSPLQIASASKAVQTRNGINLTTATNATLEIYGIKGNLISRRDFASGVHAVSLGHLPKGMYIAKVSFGNGKQILRVPVR